jgi:hypothetical protein
MKYANIQFIVIKLVHSFVLIYPKNYFDAQLHDFPGTNCHFNVGFNTSVSFVSSSDEFLRNQLTTVVGGLLFVVTVTDAQTV